MKKLILTVSLLSLAIAEVHAADVVSAIKDGKTTFQVRPRFEFVDDDGVARVLSGFEGILFTR